MLRILIFLLIGIVMAQDKLDMPYDFSRHQGYVINNGSIMWNEDWSSGNFFFDGTFASNFFHTTPINLLHVAQSLMKMLILVTQYHTS